MSCLHFFFFYSILTQTVIVKESLERYLWVCDMLAQRHCQWIFGMLLQHQKEQFMRLANS